MNDLNLQVEVLKYPTDDDWMLAKQCTLVTVGKTAINPPDLEWKRKLLEARHSPIRTLQFCFLLKDIPYWVSVHLVRHVHAQPFVRSQRNDRQNNYDRGDAPKNAPVDMCWYMNAEELMVIANKRLCGQASTETWEVVRMMCAKVMETNPEFEGLLVPMCDYHGGVCHEIQPCWRRKNKHERS